MRICFLLVLGLLAVTTASAQTSPTASTTATAPRSVTTTPPARPTVSAKPAAPVRQLTPAEERQRQKQAEWQEKERQFRVMWAAKERARAEKEAQRDREKAARRAEKEAAQRQKETKAVVANPADAPASVTTSAAPSRKPAPIASQPAAVSDRREREAQAEAAKRAQAEQRDRDKAAKRAEADRQAQADAAARVQRDQQREVERQRQKEADAAAQTARRAERERQKQADAAARNAQSRKPVSLPKTQPAPQPQPIAPPRQEVAASTRPASVRMSRAPRIRPDAPALSSDLQPDTLTSRTPVTEFFPKGHLFDPIVLDPLQSQASISVLPLFWTNSQQYGGVMVPFSFGFDKPIVRRYRDRNRTDEWGLDAASFTQFEVFHDEVDKVNRRRIINTDYRVSILYNVRRYNHVWRFRLYHLSSHLGDDYIFKNQLTFATSNPVNYEVIDATYSRQVNRWRVYGGLGFGLRRWSERKPISAEFGAYYKKPLKSNMRMVGGFDAKFWQQTNFRPGIKAGWGIELGKPANYLTFLVEGYTGFRPYSQYEDQTQSWLGLSVYLNPF